MTHEHAPSRNATDRAATAIAWLLTAALLPLLIIGIGWPDLYARLSHKDHTEHTGLIEHLTVIVLVPGILAALHALVRFYRRFPSRMHWGWVAVWTLACIYFAGEECSWGQWYFGFETPEVLEEINKQQEFNLHNTSSWLNEKPRAAVEIFVVTAGLILPVLARLGPLAAWARRPRPAWVLAPAMCWFAAAYFLAAWIVDRVTPNGRYVDAELRELAVAWFLALYLFSYYWRLRDAPVETPARATPPAGAGAPPAG